MGAVKLNLEPLNKLTKALKDARAPKVQVGILPENASRGGGGGADNAAIGAMHEFGTSKIPQRSFLREPLHEQMPKRLQNTQQFTPKDLMEVTRTGKLTAWCEKLAVIAEEIVQGAFDTGGYGKWQPIQKSDHAPLVETGQLRESISAEVV